MRPVLVSVFVVVGVAQLCVEPCGAQAVKQGSVDLSIASSTFGSHETSQTGALFRPLPPPSQDGIRLPSISFGPFHASLGGIQGRHAHLGTCEVDTESFLGSHISGSIGTRSARLVLSIPTS